MTFSVWPAIDVLGGRVVRLEQGDYARVTAYPESPEVLCERLARGGVSGVHVVDLTGARAGQWNVAAVAKAAVSVGLSVQTGGGVRSPAGALAAVEAGASRVVVGSVASSRPEELSAWSSVVPSDRLVAALDVRWRDGAWWPTLHGWTDVADVTVDVALARLVEVGVTRVLCTDIARDGMRSGPSLDLYRHIVQEFPGVQLVASGGVRGVDDVVATRRVGCAGVVVGRAWLEGVVSVADLASAARVRESAC